MVRARKNPDVRRQEILAAALDLFVRKGFRNVVIGDIAEAAGVARTTFYEYYTNKEQILVGLVDQVAGELRGIVPTGNGCREKLEDAAKRILQQIRDHQQIYRLMFAEAPVLSAALSENLVSWRQASLAQIRRIITEGKNELNPRINKDDAAYAFQALLGQRAGDMLLTGAEIHVDEESMRLVDVLWLGLAERS
jgi:AcrR family transcriptional regulator